MPGLKNMDDDITEPQPPGDGCFPVYERPYPTYRFQMFPDPNIEAKRSLMSLGKTILAISIVLSVAWTITITICFVGFFCAFLYFIILNQYYTELLMVRPNKAFAIRFLIWAGGGWGFLYLIFSLYPGSSGDMIGVLFFYLFASFIIVPSEVAYLLNETVKKHSFLEGLSSLAKTSILFPVFGVFYVVILPPKSTNVLFESLPIHVGFVKYIVIPALFYFFFGLYHYWLLNRVIPKRIAHSGYHYNEVNPHEP
ncbi:MAG: hypothetical protein KAU14_00940 [Thermoplasmata archaeon]|nr:hypothetical protein [Thermoplasmata archaeon]